MRKRGYSVMKASLSAKMKIAIMLSLAIVFRLDGASSVEAKGKLTENDIVWGVARGSNEHLELFYINSPDQQGASLCRKRCILNERCRAWSYIRRGSGCWREQEPTVCYLYSSVPNPVDNSCYASGYINPLIKLKVCQEIGNINGQGPVTCIGEGGHDLGKAGKGFAIGDEVWILMRFRRLRLGEKTASVHYSKLTDGKWMNFSKNKREWNFTNKSSSWAHWFKAHYNTPGAWRVSVSARGRDLPGYVLGHAEYTIGGPFE